jgi:hypothetical protein
VLAAERGVVLAHLGFDDGVAGLGSDRRPSLVLDELRESLGADRTVEDGGAGFLLEDVLGDEGGEQVAGDRHAFLVHDEAPVRVTVEGDAEVCPLCHDALLQFHHVLRLYRVRGVVGESAVELEVHRDVVEGEPIEDRGQHLACHAVAGVHDDLQPPQALGVYEREAVFGVIFGDVALLDGAGILGRSGQFARDYEIPDLAYSRLPREGDGVLPAELEAVVVFWVVGGRDHGPARLFQVPDGEVQRVGRDEPQVQDIRAGPGHPLYKGLLERLTGEAHIATDDDRGARETEVVHEGAADVARHVLVELVGIHAPDVVGLKD